MENKFTNYFNFDDIIVNNSNKKNIYHFLDGDTEEFFKKNLITQPYDWYYRTKEITYTINSHGYRTKEFNEIDWKESIVIFGCSHVFGIGLDDDDTLSSNISKITGRYVVNLGFPGGSNYISYYNSIMMQKKYGNPYAVIFMWSDSNRYTYFSKEKIEHLGTWSYNIFMDLKNKKYSDFDKQLSIFYNTLVDDPSHNKISHYFLLESVRNFWKDKTIFKDYSYYPHIPDFPIKIENFSSYYGHDFARDLGHPGRNTNKIISKIITEKTNEI